jgi:hypothetical protein
MVHFHHEYISVETKVETLGLLEHISLGTVKVNKTNETNYSISHAEQYRYYPDWIRHWVCGSRLQMHFRAKKDGFLVMEVDKKNDKREILKCIQRRLSG